MFSRLKDIFSPPAPVILPPPEEPQVAEVPSVEPFKDMAIETGIAGSSPDHKTAFIDHGGHMRIVSRNDEEAKKIGENALSESRFKKTVIYGETNLSGYVSGESFLKFLTLAKDGEVLTTYPLLTAGRPRKVRIMEITETDGGYEGRLQFYIGGTPFTVFDTLYYRNKGRYTPGSEVNALLGGIAYVMTRTKTSTHGDAEMAIHYENGEADEYLFRGVAVEVMPITALGKKAQIIRTVFHSGYSSEPFEIYLCATENAIPERIHRGDHISGIVWLQGFIVE